MFEKPLSPTTQAVSNAANEAFWDWGDMRPSSNNIAAAALRAAAEQGILSAEHIQGTPDDWENGWNAAMQYIKTIAKELEETK
jgi:hypothetical protein